MAKQILFRCDNKFGDPQKGEAPCEIGRQPSPKNQVAFSAADLKLQEDPPKCPKCKKPLRRITPASSAKPPLLKIIGAVIGLVVLGLVLDQIIRCRGEPKIAGLSPTIEFVLAAGDSTVSREVTIRNDGTCKLVVSEVRSDQNAFQISESKLEIPKGGESKIQIVYTDGPNIAKTGTLTLVSNDKEFPEVKIELKVMSADPWKFLEDYYSRSKIIAP
jgi:hypothetical protein